MTAQEKAEVEDFAAFVIARRRLRRLGVRTDDISTQELMQLVSDSGSFAWLNSEREDVYSVKDGAAVQWPNGNTN
jgi:hypothetical protein